MGVWGTSGVCVYEDMRVWRYVCMGVWVYGDVDGHDILLQILTEEHVTAEEVMSQQSHDHCGEERRGRGESESLIGLRTESELSGEISSGSKSPNLGGGGGGEEEIVMEDGEDSWQAWSEVLKNWDENFKRNGKHIRQMVRDGIPGPLRGMAWQLMCGAQDLHLRDRYPVLLTVSRALEHRNCSGKIFRGGKPMF